MEYQILKFDSELFGFKVAKINSLKLTLDKLKTILEKLQTEKIKLVYWQADSLDKQSNAAAKKLNGYLCNKQVTFLMSLKKPSTSSKKPIEVKTYTNKTVTPEMNKMAVQIGESSRFGIDPKMPKKLFHKMYHTWIKNSANKIVADEVLVIKSKNKIIGMITLAIKNGRGDISLIAVDKKYRGKNLATKLIEAAQDYFIKQKIFKLQVITQQSNIPAYKLYKKMGFKEESINNFYHFWL